MPTDRTIVHTVHTDDGATEIYWTRAQNDHPIDGEPWQGSILIHNDGSITHKCWTDSDIPIVTEIKGNRVRVAWSEDQPFGDDEALFDTDNLGYTNDGTTVTNFGARSVEC